MKISRPIFIVGPHRSGTTLLYRLLSQHPDIGFFTRFNKRLPNHPLLAHWLIRIFGRDTPKEAQSLWDRYIHNDCDIADAHDLRSEEIEWYQNSIQRILKIRSANRFLAKYPRLSLRLDWVNAIFPDCIFIHMTRDWRSVVRSAEERMIRRAKRGGGWFGVRIEEWRELQGMPYLLIAAEQFRVVTKTLEDSAQHQFKDRMFQASYENLCSDPRAEIGRIAALCDLRITPQFRNSLPGRLHSGNIKWQQGYDEPVYEKIRAQDPVFARYERHVTPDETTTVTKASHQDVHALPTRSGWLAEKKRDVPVRPS